MDAAAAKANLHGYLQHEREAVLANLEGLSEYDVRRPLTTTGTNLLGLVKHLATWEARYLGEVFGSPFPEPLPRWDVEEERLADMWATEHESREDVVGRYRRVWEHDDTFKQYLKRTRCMAVDMETATVFAAGFANRIPSGALLLVSDQPMTPEGVKTAESDRGVTRDFVERHIRIGVEALRLVRRNGRSVRHLRFEE